MRFLVALLCLFGLCQAQPLIHTKDSIEAQTLNAKYICVGRIMRLHLDEMVTNHTNCDVRLEINLRGLGQVEEYSLNVPATPAQLESWRAKGTRLLIFESKAVIDLEDPKLNEFDASANALHSAKAIIDLVRATNRRYPGVFGMETFSKSLLLDGRSASLRVPVDESLERWAHQQIESAKEQNERAYAVRALGFFFTDENIAFLKGLLTDPGTVTDNGKELHPVREAALEALKRIDIHQAKPPTHS